MKKNIYNKIKSASLTIFLILFSILNCFAQYTLTDEDVVVTRGIIESCSYNFTNKDIIIPDVLDGQTVIGIGENSFYKKGIDSLQLPPTIKTIGRYGFRENNLTKLTLPNSVTTIGEYAFAYNSLTSVSLPDSIEIVDFGAFNENRLINIQIPNMIKEIGYVAFSYNQLESVIFEAESNIKSIEGKAFSDNWNLSQIILPTNSNSDFKCYWDGNNNKYTPGDTITDFKTHYYAEAPYTLTAEDVEFSEGKIISYLNKTEKIIIIPDTINGELVMSIGDAAFAYKDISMISVTFPERINSIGNDAFRYSNISNIKLPDSLGNLGYRAFEYNELRHLVIPSKLTTIGESAFGNNLLDSITINEGVKYIDDRAFEMNNLKNLEIPKSVTTIDDKAFLWNKIEELTIPGNVNYIGRSAFDYNRISKLTLLEGIETIGPESFVMNKIESVIIPNSVKTIGAAAFLDNAITEVTIPESCTNLYGGCFNKNKITKVNGNNSLGFIFARNEDGTIDSTSIVSYGGESKNVNFIPQTIKTLSKYTFYKTSIGGVILPDSLKEIGQAAFFENNLTVIEFPSSVELIDDDAFRNNNLINVFIPKGVTKIGEEAFRFNSNLEKVEFEANSNIQRIEWYAFDNWRIKFIVLPTHAQSNFMKYADGKGNSYLPGDSIKNFQTDYDAVFNYITAVKNLESNNEIICYPNPVIENLNIIFSETQSGEIEVSIYNVLGKKILHRLHKLNGSSTFSVDTNNLSSGIYIFKIAKNGKPMISQKIIKQ